MKRRNIWPESFVSPPLFIWRLLLSPVIYGGIGLTMLGLTIGCGPKRAKNFWREIRM